MMSCVKHVGERNANGLLSIGKTNHAPFQALTRFPIASNVPLDCTISYSDLAEKAGLKEQDLKRMIRYLIAHSRVFCEPEKGMVAHSAASRRLVAEKDCMDKLALGMEECWPAHAKVGSRLSALKRDVGEVSNSL